MRWRDRRESNNVEDRRNQVRRFPVGGSGGGFRLPSGKLGIGIVLLVLVAGYYGVDLSPLLSNGGHLHSLQTTPVNSAHDDEMAKFTSVILASTEDVWSALFKKMGKTYQDPQLVIFRGATPTACGTGQSAMGPFYCPADRKVYIDLAFYEDMQHKLSANGDFAQAYVVAHEVGHHVQNLLGIATKVQELQRKSRNQTVANALSVKMELQADCFAGVWGHYMENQKALEQGDLEEALNAARAIGDDRLQQQSSGRIVPDSFTHGTSEQRYSWFKRGFDHGAINSCNTFAEQH